MVFLFVLVEKAKKRCNIYAILEFIYLMVFLFVLVKKAKKRCNIYAILEFIYLMVFLFVLVEKAKKRCNIYSILEFIYLMVFLFVLVEKVKNLCINIGIHLLDGVSIYSCRKKYRKRCDIHAQLPNWMLPSCIHHGCTKRLKACTRVLPQHTHKCKKKKGIDTHLHKLHIVQIK